MGVKFLAERILGSLALIGFEPTYFKLLTDKLRVRRSPTAPRRQNQHQFNMRSDLQAKNQTNIQTQSLLGLLK